jgi:hypothetical protein
MEIKKKVKEDTKQYLTENFKDILEKVVKHILKSKPSDPVRFLLFLRSRS